MVVSNLTPTTTVAAPQLTPVVGAAVSVLVDNTPRTFGAALFGSGIFGDPTVNFPQLSPAP